VLPVSSQAAMRSNLRHGKLNLKFLRRELKLAQFSGFPVAQ